ncbi:hypothetical protein B0H10DRAFT_1958189 [Mycena sp. CBHHK59/15]|nr:hypothetical protein B0H10DRAFT_1958189 [Mycena sp. CBHHK59/15]
MSLATVLGATLIQAAPSPVEVEGRAAEIYDCTSAYNGLNGTGRGPGQYYYCTSASWVIFSYVGSGCNLGFGSGTRYCCSGNYDASYPSQTEWLEAASLRSFCTNSNPIPMCSKFERFCLKPLDSLWTRRERVFGRAPLQSLRVLAYHDMSEPGRGSGN